MVIFNAKAQSQFKSIAPTKKYPDLAIISTKVQEIMLGLARIWQF